MFDLCLNRHTHKNMAFRKRSSTILGDALSRANSLKSIDPNLDFGKGVSLAALIAAVKSGEDKLAEYNTELSKVDGLSNEVDTLEAAANDLSTRLLSGVATAYGKDSDEYEKAGGTRTSDVKRTPKAVKTAKTSGA